MFHDRIQAGILLATKLIKYKNDAGVILAVPRGGVPVAYAIAMELELPMEVVLTKKIGHPNNKEYAVGAASLTDYFIEPGEYVSDEYIEEELTRVRARLKEMSEIFMGNEKPAKLEGKTVIIVDDGIATGRTILETVRVIRKRNPRKIVVAAPVASDSSVRLIENEADEVVVISIPASFYGVGQFYDHFEEVDDDEVVSYLKKSKDFRRTNRLS